MNPAALSYLAHKFGRPILCFVCCAWRTCLHALGLLYNCCVCYSTCLRGGDSSRVMRSNGGLCVRRRRGCDNIWTRGALRNQTPEWRQHLSSSWQPTTPHQQLQPASRHLVIINFCRCHWANDDENDDDERRRWRRGGGVTNRTYSSAQRFSGRNVHSPAVDRSWNCTIRYFNCTDTQRCPPHALNKKLSCRREASRALFLSLKPWNVA